MATTKKGKLFGVKDEPVSERPAFLGVGNLTLELTKMGRGETREGKRFSYLDYTVIESDRPDQPVDSNVTKWVFDSSFSVQKDLKLALSGLLNKPVTEIIFEEIVPLFYPESQSEPEDGEAGTGTELLAGRKVKVIGRFPKKKDGTISTFPAHDWIAVEAPLD
jgi:hypothetical protein